MDVSGVLMSCDTFVIRSAFIRSFFMLASTAFSNPSPRLLIPSLSILLSPVNSSDRILYSKFPDLKIKTAENLQKFYCEDQKDNWDGVFLIDGTPLDEKALHPVAIIAVNAEASLAADGKYAKQCVEKFWNTPLRTGDRRYYDNFLYMFAMLALSGNYRIY